MRTKKTILLELSSSYITHLLMIDTSFRGSKGSLEAARYVMRKSAANASAPKIWG
jgi:hypothetical protein